MIPAESEIERVQRELGFDRLPAIRHLQARHALGERRHRERSQPRDALLPRGDGFERVRIELAALRPGGQPPHPVA